MPVLLPSSRPRGRSERAGAGCASHHAVVIAGGGPTGLMLAAELALADVDVAVVERRADQELVGTRAGGLHARTIEILDQRGIAERFLREGQVTQLAGFAWTRLDIGDLPPGTLMASRCGSATSSASWPTGSRSSRCRSIETPR